MKKEKSAILKKKYAGSFTGKRNKKAEKIKEGQPNLFGEQDAVYNTIQEEISIVADLIKGCQDSIEKKEEQVTDLQERKRKLDLAAATVAKIRDGALEKKGKK